MTRDYRAEFNELLALKVPDNNYTAPVMAAEIVDWLRANDPDLLAGWLNENATSVVTEVLGVRQRSARSRALHRNPASVFAQHAAKFEAGDVEAMSSLDIPYAVAGGKRLGDMTPEDLDVVADDYGNRAAANLFEEAFIRALRRKVKSGTVADHFTAEQIDRLRAGLAPQNTSAA